MIIGPLLGMVLHLVLGFASIFLVFGTIILTALPFLVAYVPADVPAEEGKSEVSWLQLLGVKVLAK